MSNKRGSIRFLPEPFKLTAFLSKVARIAGSKIVNGSIDRDSKWLHRLFYVAVDSNGDTIAISHAVPYPNSDTYGDTVMSLLGRIATEACVKHMAVCIRQFRKEAHFECFM